MTFYSLTRGSTTNVDLLIPLIIFSVLEVSLFSFIVFRPLTKFSFLYLYSFIPFLHICPHEGLFLCLFISPDFGVVLSFYVLICYVLCQVLYMKNYGDNLN